MMAERDYSLLGESGKRAVQLGLADAEWYRSDIPRKEMKQFMQRSDQPAIRDTILLFALMVGFAAGGIYLWGSWYAVPFWAAYGVLYGSAMDSRWHECSHGTAFRTRWMNEWLYQVACFMMIRNPVAWRWSHTRHHTDTIIVGRDPEIVTQKPISFLRLLQNYVGIMDVISGLKVMLINARGRLDPETETYIPEMDRQKAISVARVWVLIYAATLAATFALQSWIPLMLIGLPRIYGAWHMALTGMTQHAGLADNAIDHRLNSRTVYMNPISRFIYWNMNYHVEHHMFPTVPYHALPALHQRIKDDFPEPSPSILAAYREFIPVLWRQRSEPDFYLRRPLPETAQPYKDLVTELEAADAA